MLFEFIERVEYWRKEDRISPENPWNHWRLYFRPTMVKLCKNKFKYFGQGAEFRAGSYASCCSNISIGKRVVIRPNTILFAPPPNKYNGRGSITIEDDVLLGPAIQIYTNRHRFVNPYIPIIEQGMEQPKDVVIKKGSWIGAGTIIVPGVTIGRNSVVGAGSVVTKDIPDQSLAVGVPAKIIRDLKDSNPSTCD